VRVDGFASGDYNGFHADEGEGSVDQGAEEGEEVAGGAGDAVVVCKGARISPVSEADAVVVRSAAESDDQGDKDEAEETENLDGSGYYFCFSVETDG
jgi:hypothetical protein